MSLPASPTAAVRPGAFHTTQWTQVLAARGRHLEARVALGELCQGYYEPIVAYLERSEPALPARDVAHEFFAALLEGDPLARLERDGGRFRSYLLGALKHHLSHRRAAAARLKRGAGAAHLPLAPRTDTSPGVDPPANAALSPDAAYDHAWAVTLLGHALAKLRAEFAAGRGEAEFDRLKPWLTGEAAHGDQAEAARTLGLDPGAFKASVHRLRRRFRQLVKDEVAATLQDGADVDAELRSLQQALAG
jgi:DNA-directed RNA polymerase specialized sigma24 family protein